jgi:hypothetical protein
MSNEARLGHFVPCGELFLANQHADSAIRLADVMSELNW